MTELIAEPGSYVITGSDIEFNRLDADPGAYVITGSDVDFNQIDADPGTYIITGGDLTFEAIIDADEGSYIITGSDVDFNRIDAEVGTYIITGADITFEIGIGVTPFGIPVYLFTLTGAPDGVDDVEIPIKSFQARLRSGDPTYLQIVIPGMDYATQINARQNGVMEVDLAYLIDDEYTNRETIIRANLEDIRTDKGTINQSISLTGHKQTTFVKKSITLEGVTYKSTLNGNVRYRLAQPNVYLNPGDSVTIDSDTFDANVISYFVSARKTTMEIAEA